MPRYRNVLDNAYSQVRALWCVIGIEAILIVILGIGLMRAPSTLTIHIPPDLKAGAMVRPNEPGSANVYAFAIYIFQQLYRWPTDGSMDFGNAIYALSAYLTPMYREALVSELETKARRGELAGRERGMQELLGRGFSEDRVRVLKDGVWLVIVDMELFESVQGTAVKRKQIRYPLRIVRYDIDRETNPWGLALDGFEKTGPIALVADGESG